MSGRVLTVILLFPLAFILGGIASMLTGTFGLYTGESAAPDMLAGVGIGVLVSLLGALIPNAASAILCIISLGTIDINVDAGTE